MMRLLLTFLFATAISFGQDPYWVDDNGAAAWGSAQSATPLSGTACASIDTARSNVVAGDLVYLRGGDYSDALYLSGKNGTLENRITFEGYQSESVWIKNQTNLDASYAHALGGLNSDYIVIRKINFEAQDRTLAAGPPVAYKLFEISGCDYWEIDTCVFHGNAIAFPQWTILSIANSDHGWLHDSTMYEVGYIDNTGDDFGGVLSVSYPTTSDLTNNWTIEDCTMHSGAHHVLECSAPQCVIRNNHFYNDSWATDTFGNAPQLPDDNGKYGNRNVELVRDPDNPTGDIQILLEGNRFGPTGTPSDDDGDSSNNISGIDACIVRYNHYFNCESVGFYLKGSGGQTSDNNRIYNLTIFDVGNWPAANSQLFNDGILKSGAAANNKVFNCIIWDGPEPAIQQAGSGIRLDDNGNVWTGNYVGAQSGNGEQFAYSATDPLFADETLAAAGSNSQPNLALQESSTAIDGGSALTTVAAADTGAGTSLVLDDARWFQDGTWGSSLATLGADWIAVGTVGNVARISSIDYGTNTITLGDSISRSDGESVWLYKKSDGDIVLAGPAPDQGAFEYGVITGTLTTGTLTIGP